jgi:hypothetical protein
MLLKGKEKDKKFEKKYKLGLCIFLVSFLLFLIPISFQFQSPDSVSISVSETHAAWYDYIISVPSSIGGALGDAGKWIVTKIAEFFIRSIIFVIFAVLWCIYYIIYSLVGTS